MKTLYYICINRDERREFNYSTSIEKKQVSEKEYDLYKFDERPIAIVRQPTEHNMAIVSFSRDHMECFQTGIGFQQNRYDLWNEMYDDFLDEKLKKEVSQYGEENNGQT